MLGKGCVVLLWHSLCLPYKNFVLSGAVLLGSPQECYSRGSSNDMYTAVNKFFFQFIVISSLVSFFSHALSFKRQLDNTKIS